MASVLDLLSGSIDENTVHQMAKQLGADDQATEQALSAAMPMLLGALGKNTSTPEGANALMGALDRNHDGSILDDVMGYMSDPATMNDGAKILGHILGGKEGTVENGIAQVTGLDKKTVAQLMTMAAPLVMGALAREKKEQNMNAQDMAAMLQQERESTEKKLTGLAAMLDMDGDGDVTDDLSVLGSSLLGSFFGRKRS